MEIKIKTLGELRDSRVTLEIQAEPGEVVEAVQRIFTPVEDNHYEQARQRLYTADEVGYYQATEAKLLTAPLRARLAQLEKVQEALAVTKTSREHNRAKYLKEKERADQLDSEVNDANQSIRVLRGQLKQSENRAEMLDMNWRTERARADAAEQKRAAMAKELSQVRAGLEDCRKEVTNWLASLGRISGALSGPEIREALNDDRLDIHTRWLRLADAVRAVRKEVGLPEA